MSIVFCAVKIYLSQQDKGLRNKWQRTYETRELNWIPPLKKTGGCCCFWVPLRNTVWSDFLKRQRKMENYVQNRHSGRSNLLPRLVTDFMHDLSNMKTSQIIHQHWAASQGNLTTNFSLCRKSCFPKIESFWHKIQIHTESQNTSGLWLITWNPGY